MKISPEETQYLCAAVSEHYTQPLTPAGVFWSFAGVRPLFGDGGDGPASVTRDYVLELDTGDGGTEAPLLSVFGGKITTYRRRPTQPTIGLRYCQYSSTCCTICGGLIHI